MYPIAPIVGKCSNLVKAVYVMVFLALMGLLWMITGWHPLVVVAASLIGLPLLLWIPFGFFVDRSEAKSPFRATLITGSNGHINLTYGGED